MVDARRPFQGLKDLGHEHLGGENPSVASEPRLPTHLCELHDAIRLILRTMMLPQLHPGVRLITKLRQLTHGGAIRLRGHDRRRGDIQSDPDNLRGIDLGILDALANYDLKCLHVVSRVLERKIRRQFLSVRRTQHPVHDAMRVLMDSSAHFGTVANSDDDSTSRQSAKIQSHHELVGHDPLLDAVVGWGRGE